MTNRRLIVFDVDITLAPINGILSRTTIECLKLLNSDPNNIIVICSGKSTTYLNGLFRRMLCKWR